MRVAILGASKRHRVSAKYLGRLARIESSFNPNAANPGSSAKGLYQFINSTGNQYGLHGSGFFDAGQSADAAARLTKDNARALHRLLGRSPSFGEVYSAHLLGLGGSRALLRHKGSPRTAASILPEAASSNRQLFYKENGAARSVDEFMALLERKMS